MTRDRSCAMCVNWFQSDAVPSFNGEVVGECHRHAPRPELGSKEAHMVSWPLTRESDVCGDWYFGGERPVVHESEHPVDENKPTTEMPLAETVGEDD